MLVIRIKRKGKKNQPFFRIVVTDKRTSAKGGKSIDDVGYFDPLTKRSTLDKERVLHWLKVGAKPSDTVHNMIVSEKIIDAKKINLTKKSKKPVEATSTDAKAMADKPAAPAPETPAVEQPVEVKTEEPKEQKIEEPKVAEPAP